MFSWTVGQHGVLVHGLSPSSSVWKQSVQGGHHTHIPFSGTWDILNKLVLLSLSPQPWQTPGPLILEDPDALGFACPAARFLPTAAASLALRRTQ